jgi:prophage regulatory protein
MRNRRRILRIHQVTELVGVSKPTIYRWMKAGHFPRRIRLGGNSVGWFEHEVQDWLSQARKMRTRIELLDQLQRQRERGEDPA